MAKILNWHIFRSEIKKRGILIFTSHDVARIFNISTVAVSFFLFRNTRKGLLIRLKKSQKGSLYCLADELPNRYLIANRIYEPSYISFDTALSYHNIIPESVYTIYSATPKSTREFFITDVRFMYHRIKKSVYVGYEPIQYQHTTILMASAEKALADYLYFVVIKKRTLQYERLALERIDKKELFGFIKLYGKPPLVDLVTKIYADYRKIKRAQ